LPVSPLSRPGDYLVAASLSAARHSVVSNLLTFDYIGFDLDRQAIRASPPWSTSVLAHPAFRQAFAGRRYDGRDGLVWCQIALKPVVERIHGCLRGRL